MLGALLLILIILWFLGYVRIEGLSIPDIQLFVINGQAITLWNLLILFVIAALIGILPSPVREIAGVLLILWVLSVLGIIAIVNLSSILIITIIIGVILALIGI